MNIRIYFLAAMCSLCSFVLGQTSIPYLPAQDDFKGVPLAVLSEFVPSVGDYTLEVQGTTGVPISIAFSNLSYTPTQTGKVRFVQKDGKITSSGKKVFIP